MVLLFGVPGAIAFTVLHGIWWTFFLAGGLATVFFVLSEVSDRKTRLPDDDGPSSGRPGCS